VCHHERIEKGSEIGRGGYIQVYPPNCMYKHILKPIFFRFDPEFVHDKIVGLGAFMGRFNSGKKLLSTILNFEDPILEQDILGIHFKNPIGLAAGFDKNAELTDTIPSIGFGHMEVGSITAKRCIGNPKPRLWRLKDSQSLVVYYGLKNDGAEAIYSRLKNKFFAIPVSTSIAMTNCKENMEIDTAIHDYVEGFGRFTELGSFFTVNVSCPNTIGGQPFMDPDNLDKLLARLDPISTAKPVFVKLSPDVSDEQVDKIYNVLINHRVQGIICSNLTKPRTNEKIIDKNVPEKGGLSGKVVQELSDKLLAKLYRRSPGKFVLIGCGGVFTAEDAYKKIRLGASLIHMVTGMIFEGPQVISKINRELAELLRRDGFANISQAIGVDNK
jgi:dihydroorotate dehydrogenase